MLIIIYGKLANKQSNKGITTKLLAIFIVNQIWGNNFVQQFIGHKIEK